MCLLVVGSAKATSIYVNTTPATIAVGDKVTITIQVTDPPADAAGLELYIDNSLKYNYNPGAGTTGVNYDYTWNTKIAGSTAGEHQVIVKLLKSDGSVIASESKPYTLAPATTTTTPGTTTTNPPSTTQGETEAKSSAATGFDLGQLGTVVFPSTKVHDANDLIVVIIKWLLDILAALAVIAIIYSGIMYMTSSGDQAKSEIAKKNLIWAIIGVIIVALSFFIVELIAKVIKEGL